MSDDNEEIPLSPHVTRYNRRKAKWKSKILEVSQRKQNEASLSRNSCSVSEFGSSSILSNTCDIKTKQESVQSVNFTSEIEFKTPPRAPKRPKIEKSPRSPELFPDLDDDVIDEKMLETFPEFATQTKHEPISDDDDDEENVIFTQKLSDLQNVVVPEYQPQFDIDIFASARFMQGLIELPKKGPDPFEQIPPELIAILDGKHSKVEKSEEMLCDELFVDPIYGGLGYDYDKPRSETPKFIPFRDRLRQKTEKSEFKPPNAICDFMGSVVEPLKEDILSQIPPVRLTKRKSIDLKSLPKEICGIVEEFEELEEYETSPTCSPMQLIVKKPQKSYENRGIVRAPVFNSSKTPISVPIDDETDDTDEEKIDISLCDSIKRQKIRSEIDFPLESNIIFELAGLSQSFKSDKSFEKSFTSPERHLVTLQIKCDSPLMCSSVESTPKSQKSLHLSDLGSQEILQDEDLLEKKSVGTSPIKFDHVSEPTPLKMSPEMPFPLPVPLTETGFTGFAFASGQKPEINPNKAMNLFSDIFEEFKLAPLPAATTNFGGFQTLQLPPKDIQPKNNDFNSSLDEELPPDILKDISHIEKVGLQRISNVTSPLKSVENFTNLRPKRVNDLRTPAIPNVTSPGIESPEGFISALANRGTAQTSTPINRNSVSLRHSNVKRTKLINRITENASIEKKNNDPNEMSDEEKRMQEVAYAKQAEYIAKKPESEKKPTLGVLTVRKTQGNRLKWKDFVKEELVKKEIAFKVVSSSEDVTNNGTEITFSNARSFRFNLLQFVSKSELISNEMFYKISSDISIVPDIKFRAGFNEFLKTFMTLPGTDNSLFTPKWFQHHYKMSVLKLFRYTQRLKVSSGVFLTPENVINMIKYRYDIEIDKFRRSALRRCTEGDDIPCKRLVLEVIEVTNDFLVVSDGWYAIRTYVDEELKRVLRLGTKFVTTNAEIRNLKEACHPLQISDEVILKIAYNSTRRAGEEAKLGFQRDPGPLTIHVNDIKLNGGLVSSVLVYVTRVYPINFYDKRTKSYHNEQQERRLQDELEIEREKKAAKIVEETTTEVRREFSERRNMSASPRSISIKRARQMLEEDGQLTESQRNLIRNENDRINDEIVKRAFDRSITTLARDVTRCLKFRVLDVRNGSKDVLITYWSPEDELIRSLKENVMYNVTNLMPNKSHGIILFSTNKTSIKSVSNVESTVSDDFQRKITGIDKIVEVTNPPFNEMDVFGLVVFVDEKDHIQIVYLSNANADFVQINFYSSMQETGNNIKEGTFLLFENLEWREKGSNTEIPTLFVSPLHTKITNFSVKKATEKIQTFIDKFHNINLNEISKKVSSELGHYLNIQKINESLGNLSTSNSTSEQNIVLSQGKRKSSRMNKSSGLKKTCT